MSQVVGNLINLGGSLATGNFTGVISQGGNLLSGLLTGGGSSPPRYTQAKVQDLINRLKLSGKNGENSDTAFDSFLWDGYSVNNQFSDNFAIEIEKFLAGDMTTYNRYKDIISRGGKRSNDWQAQNDISPDGGFFSGDNSAIIYIIIAVAVYFLVLK